MWNSPNYIGNELNITKKQAAQGSHSGACDESIAALRKVPAIRRQLIKLDPANLKRELKEYGAWSEEELENHDDNLSRWLWLSCADINERVGLIYLEVSNR